VTKNLVSARDGFQPSKTFLLGVGAQKCGTTWLYRYLESQDTADLGFAKEYHIWDGIYTPELKQKYKVKWFELFKSPKHRRLWLMQNIHSSYFSYFCSLLSPKNINVTADISPSYSSLGRNVLEMIDRGFGARKVSCKVIFIMRDPVERCLSAAAMHKKKGRYGDKHDYSQDIIDYAKSTQSYIRTNYKKTVSEIEAVFPQSRIYFGIYEEMFSDEKIIDLSNFLQVAPNLEFKNMKFKVSQKLLVDENIRRHIARHYRGVYEFAGARFPETIQLWKGFRYL
jgi:hypothetical protein